MKKKVVKKMNTTKDRHTKLRHTLVVCLTSCLFIFGLAISFWNYKATKEDNQRAIKRDFQRIEFLVNELSRLKKDQVRNISSQVSGLVKFRSALSTNDSATIEDALEEIRKSRKLNFLTIVKNKRIAFIDKLNSSQNNIKQLVRSHFLGVQKLSNQRVLIAGVGLTERERKRWSKITGAEITMGSESVPKSEDLRISKDNQWYQSQIQLLKGTLLLNIRKNRADYWRDFKAREKKTIVFMGALFLFCLFLSWFIGGFISKMMTHQEGVDPEEFKEFVLELRKLKAEN